MSQSVTHLLKASLFNKLYLISDVRIIQLKERKKVANQNMPKSLAKNQNLAWAKKEHESLLEGSAVKIVLSFEIIFEIKHKWKFYLLNEHDDNFGCSAQVVRKSMMNTRMILLKFKTASKFIFLLLSLSVCHVDGNCVGIK